MSQEEGLTSHYHDIFYYILQNFSLMDDTWFEFQDTTG